MDITYFGGSCFRIIERGHTSLLTDPYMSAEAVADKRLKADLVTLSHKRAQDPPAIPDCQYIIRGAGEYEVGELFVTGIPLHRHVEAEGQTLDNVACLIEYPNGLTLLHLGALRAAPDLSIAELLDVVHTLMLPIGGADIGSDQMADLISAIEPTFVIPMRHVGLADEDYPEALEEFLKAMGVGEVAERDNLRLSMSSLPETTQVAPLRAQ